VTVLDKDEIMMSAYAQKFQEGFLMREAAAA
jgi:hypothetical protein